MLPLILVAVGAYLIGDSVLEDKKYAKGGMMAKGGEVTEQEAKEKLVKLKEDGKLNFSIGNHGLIFMSLKNGNKKSYDNYKKAYEHYLESKDVKTQGYDDKEDERLAMEHGKMAKKDLDSTHARRDDARFEERGKMAKGGELEWANEENEKLGKWLLSNQSGKKILEDSKNSKELEKNVRDYAKEHNGVAGLEMDDEDEGLEWVTFDDLYKELKSRSKMARGGKLVGKQKNLDVNKNGKLDAEDFKMLRKGKK